MKTSILFFICLASIVSLEAQTIPDFNGETADNKNIKIPVDLLGKYSLLCFASSQKAETDLESWLEPVYQKFIAKTGLMDDMYDLNIYFIPVLTGTNISFAASIKKKFKENTTEELRDHILFCTQRGKEIINVLEMQKSDVPYFLLLDKNAKIIYRTSGGFTDEKFDAIDDLIE